MLLRTSSRPLLPRKATTTANRARLEAALEELMKYMPSVYKGSYRSDENLAKFPHGAEVEMEEEVAGLYREAGGCGGEQGKYLPTGLFLEFARGPDGRLVESEACLLTEVCSKCGEQSSAAHF